MKKLLFILLLLPALVFGQVHRGVVQQQSNLNSTPVTALEIGFDDIANADALISGGADTVGYWNTFFGFDSDPSLYTSIFSSVTVDGNLVKLYGGAGITMKESLFDDAVGYGVHLLSFDDKAGCIVECEYSAFGADNNSGCPNLVTVNLPNCIIFGNYCFRYCTSLTTIDCGSGTTFGNYCFDNCTSLITIDCGSGTTFGEWCFAYCTSLTTIDLSSCANLGITTGDDLVFTSITGQTITMTVHASLLTCNGGAPDGDLCYLNANNTLTINGGSLSGCPE